MDIEYHRLRKQLKAMMKNAINYNLKKLRKESRNEIYLNLTALLLF
jgi:hypothetical protein